MWCVHVACTGSLHILTNTDTTSPNTKEVERNCILHKCSINISQDEDDLIKQNARIQQILARRIDIKKVLFAEILKLLIHRCDFLIHILCKML